MQSYLKCKRYYDKKATATPLKVNDYIYVLNSKADNQSMKFASKDCIWTGFYIVVRVLSNNNYVVRRTGTRFTQTLQKVRLRLYASNQLSEGKSIFQIQRLKQPMMIGTRQLGKPTSEKFCSERLQKIHQKMPQLWKSRTREEDDASTTEIEVVKTTTVENTEEDKTSSGNFRSFILDVSDNPYILSLLPQESPPKTPELSPLFLAETMKK